MRDFERERERDFERERDSIKTYARNDDDVVGLWNGQFETLSFKEFRNDDENECKHTDECE